MDANVLREFLVKIGFSVDRAGLRALYDGLKTVTTTVEGLAKAAVGMAAAVTAAVTVTARSLDELYYSAQRAESTAEGLMTIGHAARSVGLTAAGVRGQIEGLAASFRDMPAMKSWLSSLTGATGTPEEMMTGFARYYARMRAQGRELLARMVLRAGGVDPELPRQIAMNLPAYLKSKEEMSAWFRALGFNAGQAQESSVSFVRELIRSWGLFKTIWDKLTVTLLPVLQVGLRSLNDLVVAHLDDIRAFVDGPLRDMVRYLADPVTWERWKKNIEDAAAVLRKELGDGIDYVRNHWRDFSNEASRIWGQLREDIIAAKKVLDELVEHRQAIGMGVLALGVATRSPAMIAVGAGLIGSAPLPGEKGYQPGAETDADKLERRYQQGDTPWQKLKDWLSGLTHSPNVDIYEAKGLWSRLKEWMSGSQSTVPTVALADDTITRLLDSLGYDVNGKPKPPGAPRRAPGSRNVGTGGGETGSPLGDAVIPPGSDEEMARAAIAAAGGNEKAQAGLLANFYAESGLRRDKPGPGGDFGWAQWVGSRKRALFSWAAARNLSPYSAEAQAGFLNHELTTNPAFAAMIKKMNAAPNAVEAAKISGFIFEQGGGSPGLFGGGRFSQGGLDAFHSKGAEGIYQRIHRAHSFEPRVSNLNHIDGDRSVTISPSTVINVHGGDAASTGRQVAGAQDRITENMVRAFQPVAG